MKKTYHLCLSAGDEVLFRDIEDYNRGFNCFALALYKTGSTGLVETIMSTHTHQMVQTEYPDDFMHCYRLSYAKYFNCKYQREGKLGEKNHFALDVVGYNHMIAAMSYTLRNALHHGVAPIPYAYPHSSVNAIFRAEMGKPPHENLLHPRYYHRYLGKAAVCPPGYKMSSSGVFLRETVLDIPQVESLFSTPRAFNYYMTRKSSEEWLSEQKKDNVALPPFTLESVESGVGMHSVDKMLRYESGKADYRRITDIELCTEIDRRVREKLGRASIYHLSDREKITLAEELYNEYAVDPAKLKRCLVL